jgi:hypothetical protein
MLKEFRILLIHLSILKHLNQDSFVSHLDSHYHQCHIHEIQIHPDDLLLTKTLMNDFLMYELSRDLQQL